MSGCTLSVYYISSSDISLEIMDYFPFILLGHQVLDFLFSALSLHFSINVLFRKSLLKKSGNISSTMTVNFVYVFIFAIASLIYHIYLFIFWRLDSIIYDGRILYVTGVIPWILMMTNSVMEFFLCIDRCLSVVFPFKYNGTQKNVFTILTIFGFIGGAVIIVYFCNLVFLYPADPVTTCRFFGCFVQANNFSMLMVKIIFILSNLVVALTLALLIKFVFKTNNASIKHMNNTVLIMVICTTFIELIPFVVAQIFYTVGW